MTQTAPIRKTAASVVVAPRPRAAPVALRLNAFQLLMRRWSALAPYNAAQVMQVSGEADMDLWQAAAQRVLADLGLGIPDFSKGDARVEFRPVSQVAVATAEDFTLLLNTELNRGFLPDELPIRFFVFSKGDGSHLFAAVYDHWIADSRAMRELMQRIFMHYQSLEGPQLAPLRFPTAPFRRLYRKYTGVFPRSFAISQAIFNIVRHRRVCRINLPDPLDFNARVISRRLPDGLIQRIHAHAVRHRASVNDVFLAALAQTMGGATERTRYRKRRRWFRLRRDRIGLGSIVDIRSSASEPLDDVFGLYLSSYTVAIAAPEKRAFEDLLGEIAGTTRAIKQKNTAARSFGAFATARWWWDRFGRARDKALFFQKTVPLAAGISNVNMTDSWADLAALGADHPQPHVLDYIRVSPTGPLLPLVFTLTTVGTRLSLCVTYRTTAFSAEQARALVDDFVSRLAPLA